MSNPSIPAASGFNYSPLPQEGCTIRLIKLVPSVNHAPICIQLFERELKSAGYFEALSYTWGNNILNEEVLCGDQIIHVSSMADIFLMF